MRNDCLRKAPRLCVCLSVCVTKKELFSNCDKDVSIALRSCSFAHSSESENKMVASDCVENILRIKKKKMHFLRKTKQKKIRTSGKFPHNWPKLERCRLGVPFHFLFERNKPVKGGKNRIAQETGNMAADPPECVAHLNTQNSHKLVARKDNARQKKKKKSLQIDFK